MEEDERNMTKKNKLWVMTVFLFALDIVLLVSPFLVSSSRSDTEAFRSIALFLFLVWPITLTLAIRTPGSSLN